MTVISVLNESHIFYFFFFFFNDTATTEIYTLSLHDALPIPEQPQRGVDDRRAGAGRLRVGGLRRRGHGRDRKSTRLNSSHSSISYAVFCLKKKKKHKQHRKQEKKKKNTK